MRHPLIENQLQCERKGWHDTAIIRCPKDWSDEYIQTIAKEYDAAIVWGPCIEGQRVVHLRVPVNRPPSLLDEVCIMLRKNRKIQDKAWAEYRAQREKERHERNS